MTAPACGSCAAPTGDGATLCQGCTRELALALIQAASIAPDLDDAVAKRLTRGTGGPRGSEVPLPYDEAAKKASDALWAVLAEWVRAVAGPGESWPQRNTIGGAANWLAVRLDVIRQHPDGGEAHRGILAAVHRAVTVVDRLPERAPAGTCADCGAQLLAELGADSVTCACGLRIDGIAEQRARRAAAADVLGTATEISDALAALGITVDASKIRAWKTRGRLTARPGGFVALSDVLDLHAKQPKVRG